MTLEVVDTSSIAIVLPSLSLGGSERAGSEIANAWAAAGHRVAVITSRGESDDFYRLDPAVKRVALGVSGASRGPVAAVRGNFAHISRLRRSLMALQRDWGLTVVLAFVDRTSVRTLIAARPLGVPVIVAERNDLTIRSAGRVWEWLRRRTYRNAAAVVVQTQRARTALEDAVPGLRRVEVIPNFVPDGVIASSAAPASRRGVRRNAGGQDANSRHVLAVGRLHPQKGFDLLLEAFAVALRCVQGWKLVILGEGPERNTLEEKARELGLEHAVRFVGAVDDPVPYYLENDVFVLSSRYEGFPNALLEAMACGLPPVAFDCPAGPREIIEHGANGMLVPAENVRALASALEKLMDDPALRRRLASEATEVRRRFGKPAVLQQWQSLISECTRQRNRGAVRSGHG